MGHDQTIHHDTSEPYVKRIAVFVALSVFVLGLFLVWTGYYYNTVLSNIQDEKEAQVVPEELNALRLYEQEQLNLLSRSGPGVEVVRVPIDWAIPLVVRSYAK